MFFFFVQSRIQQKIILFKYRSCTKHDKNTMEMENRIKHSIIGELGMFGNYTNAYFPVTRKNIESRI